MNKQLNCILLIDDDEPTNFLNKITLEQMGCTRHIRVAQSGQEALQYLMTSDPGDPCSPKTAHTSRNGKTPPGNVMDYRPRPDLIFLDINMPAMDGWEFLERYKLLPAEQKADIVLIMLTTSLNPDDEIRTRTIPEISGFENKPLKQSQVEAVLTKYFNNKA